MWLKYIDTVNRKKNACNIHYIEFKSLFIAQCWNWIDIENRYCAWELATKSNTCSERHLFWEPPHLHVARNRFHLHCAIHWGSLTQRVRLQRADFFPSKSLTLTLKGLIKTSTHLQQTVYLHVYTGSKRDFIYNQLTESSVKRVVGYHEHIYCSLRSVYA